MRVLSQKEMKNDLISTAAFPVCILRDSVNDGRRINKFAHYNELFRQNPKPLARRGGGELGGSVFTAYHYHEGLEILRITKGECRTVINKKSYLHLVVKGSLFFRKIIKSDTLFCITLYKSIYFRLKIVKKPFCFKKFSVKDSSHCSPAFCFVA